jgi:hypothetical protein
MPALVTTVLIFVMTVAAVTSTGSWVKKGMLVDEPDSVAVLVAAPTDGGFRLSTLVPALDTSVFRAAFSATRLTGAVAPAGRVTVRMRAPLGGGGGLGEGEGLGGGEQHRTDNPVAPVRVPVQA